MIEHDLTEPGSADYSQCVPGTSTSISLPPPSPPATTTSAPPSTSAPTSTSTGPTPTGSQIRADDDPVFHFYLQSNGIYPVCMTQNYH